MKTHPWREIRDRFRDPESEARIAEIRRGMHDVMRLAELREQRGKTQSDLAAVLDVNQRTVSKIEHSENPYLETLREYVEALGGELHLTAVFPDETVELAATVK
ncbi:MAG: helix-turn-helix transcriptional regulator [Thermomicrobiales bacterium]